MIQNHPDRTITYYFLAISYDRSGNCQRALANYILFNEKADPVRSKREIDNATIRISLLNKLVKEGNCKSQNKGKNR